MLSTHHLLAATVALGLATAASAQPAEAPATDGTAWLNKQMTALAERHGADGWRVTPSGLRWRRVAGDGSGARPGPADRVTVHALLDSPSVAGAYRFHIYPDGDSVVDVGAVLYPRKPIEKLGLAPLTSMFFTGENDRRFYDDFRSELHDSDGLMIHSGTGEWIWRPLRNPRRQAVSSFVERNLRGFGLMQRDRTFEHYQDLDLAYELRPSYWIEPQGDWGEGVVELIEIPTTDETNDNIVALWAPKTPPTRASSPKRPLRTPRRSKATRVRTTVNTTKPG